MSDSHLTTPSPQPLSVGEVPGPDLTPAQRAFLSQVAYPNLNKSPTCDDQLKHIADVWWNLCQWEKQRADVLDGKAQSLVGLASIASAVVAVVGPTMASSANWGGAFRFLAVLAFLVTAICAVRALRIADHGGFYDIDVFNALGIHASPTDPAASVDKDPFRTYLREIAAQRWLVYSMYKSASAVKAEKIVVAQWWAIGALSLLVASVLVQSLGL